MLARGVILQSRAGARYYPVGTPKETVTGRKDARWLQVAKRLQEEVFTGDYGGQGGLPTFHALGKRLGCSLTTLVKAVGYLESQGVLRRQGRKFLPMEKKPKNTAGSTIVFASSANILSAYQSHGFPFVRFLERELRQRGWGQLHMALSDSPDASLLPPPHRTGGVIYLPSTNIRGWGPLFRSRPRFPLIVVNLQEEIRGDYPEFKHFFRLLPDNRFAGMQIAEWLMQSGHTRCAFFSHLPGHLPWISLRLQGLRQVFRGDGACLEFFAGPGEPGSSYPWFRNAQLHRLTRSFREELHLPDSVTKALFHQPQSLAENHGRMQSMNPLFAAAFADESITAWICVNDELAVCARAFLVEQERTGRKRHVKLAGFDNSPISYSLRFTSYDFGLESMASMAVHALERPGDMARIAPNHCHRVRGDLIIRG